MSASLLGVVEAFVGELRSAGMPVSLTENLDALAALGSVDLGDRAVVKTALGATLVKDQAHWATFEAVFELFFALPPGIAEAPGDEAPGDGATSLPEAGEAGHGGTATPPPGDLVELLLAALVAGDAGRLRQVARAAVERYAGIEPGRAVGGSYYLYRTLRALDLDRLLERLVEQEQLSGGAPGRSLAGRLARDEGRRRVRSFRDEVESEIRRRLVADRGAEAVARSVRRPLPQDVDFMHATREEMAALRRALHPLTSRLAARLVRRRRHGRRGPLDFRSTVRHSLSTGGVPIEPRFRRPRPAKPEIVVVADISGSVAAFARFTLCLVHAINAQFSKVRSFVFIDGIDEVTHLFEESDDVAEAVSRVSAEADVVYLDGHSDYGHALETFWERWGTQVGPRSTVLVLGDARSNYHPSGAWALAEVSARARHLWWLDPEPRSYWDTGDSIISQYAPHCDAVFECRNLRQLQAFVDHLA
ncbi:MAG: vWA domain-containing protein [Acidimicrobiales bacterium]